jgi:hypothetical protein
MCNPFRGQASAYDEATPQGLGANYRKADVQYCSKEFINLHLKMGQDTFFKVFIQNL